MKVTRERRNGTWRWSRCDFPHHLDIGSRNSRPNYDQITRQAGSVSRRRPTSNQHPRKLCCIFTNDNRERVREELERAKREGKRLGHLKSRLGPERAAQVFEENGCDVEKTVGELEVSKAIFYRRLKKVG